MPHTLGIMDNDQPVPEEYREQTLGHLFVRAGYDCAYGGKWHVTRIAMEEGFAFERIAGFDDNALPPAAMEFLRTPRDRPFLLVASFDNPHNICEHSRNQPLPWGEVPLAPTDECPNLPPNFSAGPYEPEALRTYAERAGMYRRRPAYTADRWRLLRHLPDRIDDLPLGGLLGAATRLGRGNQRRDHPPLGVRAIRAIACPFAHTSWTCAGSLPLIRRPLTVRASVRP